MQNKLALILVLTLLRGLVLTGSCLAEEDYLTITTYYPSPYGSYNELDTRILWFGEEKDGLIGFNYPDTTYDRRLRITAGKEDRDALGFPVTNTQGASIDLHGNDRPQDTALGGELHLVAGSKGGPILFYTGTSVAERMRITNVGNVGIGTPDPGIWRLRVAGGSAAVDAGQSWTTTSDVRLKKNIMPIADGLLKVIKLKGIMYNKLDETDDAEKHIGFLAQDVEKVAPDLVITGSDGYKALDYSRISVLLVEAVKELRLKNAKLEARIKVLEEK